MPYQAVYYRDSDGNEPVTRAIDRLPVECQDSVDWSIGLLNSLSDARPGLPHPYSSALKGGKYRAFRELRASCGGTHYRIIFRRSHRFLYSCISSAKTPTRFPRRRRSSRSSGGSTSPLEWTPRSAIRHGRWAGTLPES